MNLHACLMVGILALSALSGCLGDDELEDAGTDDRPGSSRQATGPGGDLFGWIVDSLFEPIEGAAVSVVGGEANVTTNATGYYSFPQLPRQEELFLMAEHPEYTTQPKRVLLPLEGSMRLNFTLEPRPVKVPYSDVQEFTGLLSCQAVVAYDEGHRHAATSGRDTADSGREEEDRQTIDCGFADENRADHWEFSVAPELAGAVIEVAWDANTEFSRNLRMIVETTGYGAEDAELAQVMGPSVLSGQINQHQSERFYSEGGIVRVSFEVDANVEDEETMTGVALAYQQQFDVYATLFYVTPPPATYSYFDS